MISYKCNEEKCMQLLFGDCLEVMKQIPDQSVDMVLCDPPYGMRFQSNCRKELYRKIEGDDSFFLTNILLNQLNRVLKENSHIYIFCSFHLVDRFKQALEGIFIVKNILIWKKNNTGMGDLKGDYAPKYEMILFCVKGRRLLEGRRDSNILEFNRTNNNFHPTEKPIDLLEFLINKSSLQTETVLDFTMGSGSTGVACVNTNRNFIGIEKDRHYFQVAVERIEKAKEEHSAIQMPSL